VRKLDPAFDLQRYYSSVISQTPSTKTLAAAISGFHESGGKWPWAEYSKWLRHRAVAVRAVALRAYAAAYPGESQSALEDCLFGLKGTTLEKLSFAILARRPGALPASTLCKVIESSSRKSSQLRALALINTKDKWESLEHFFHFARDKDEALSAAALRWLHVWRNRFNRSFTQPSAAQLENLLRELALSKTRLSSSHHLFLLDFEDLLATILSS
jgi:hypothetical protein